MAKQSGPTATPAPRTDPRAVARQFQQRVLGRAELDSTHSDPADIVAGVIARMSEAESWDDIVAAQGGTNQLEDYLGQPLNIYEVSFSRSADKWADSGLGAFVVLHGFTDDGTQFVVTSGASNVVAAFYRASEAGLIREDQPLRCKIVTQETANGMLHRVAKA